MYQYGNIRMYLIYNLNRNNDIIIIIYNILNIII